MKIKHTFSHSASLRATVLIALCAIFCHQQSHAQIMKQSQTVLGNKKVFVVSDKNAVGRTFDSLNVDTEIQERILPALSVVGNVDKKTFVVTDIENVKKTLDSLGIDAKTKERILSAFEASNSRSRSFSFSTTTSDGPDSTKRAEMKARMQERIEKRKKDQQESMASAALASQKKLEEALLALQEVQREAQKDIQKNADAPNNADKKLSEARKKLNEAQQELMKAKSNRMQASIRTMNRLHHLPNMMFHLNELHGTGELENINEIVEEAMEGSLGSVQFSMPKIRVFTESDDDGNAEVFINRGSGAMRERQLRTPHSGTKQIFRYKFDGKDDESEEKHIIIKKNGNGSVTIEADGNVEIEDADKAEAPKAPAPPKTPKKAPNKPAQTPKVPEKSNFQE